MDSKAENNSEFQEVILEENVNDSCSNQNLGKENGIDHSENENENIQNGYFEENSHYCASSDEERHLENTNEKKEKPDNNDGCTKSDVEIIVCEVTEKLHCEDLDGGDDVDENEEGLNPDPLIEPEQESFDIGPELEPVPEEKESGSNDDENEDTVDDTYDADNENDTDTSSSKKEAKFGFLIPSSGGLGTKDTENHSPDDRSHIPDFTGMKRSMSDNKIPMSTKVKVVDSEALHHAIMEVRSDTGVSGRKAWVLVGHVDNNPNVINLIGKDISDNANIQDFCDKLTDDQVMYGLLRLNTTVDMSNTVKFVYIKWIGDNVPYAKRGRYGVVSGNVEEQFGSSHAAVETGNKEDLIEEELVKMWLEESSFTRNKILVDIEGRQERGFTQHSYQSNKSYDKNQVRNKLPAAAVVEVTPEVTAAIEQVRDDQNNIRWLLCGFEDGNLRKQWMKQPLILYDKGEGDINSLKSKIEDDKVMYGLYRSSDVIDDINTVKFVYFSWVGPDVKPMIRGKVSTFAGPVEKIFNAHVSLLFYNKHEIGENVITDKVKASSGSKLWVKS